MAKTEIKSQIVHSVVPMEIAAELRARAEAEDRTVSNVIKRAVNVYLNTPTEHR